MAGQLRHMLRDDDINHAEQKQILELGMKFRENRFYRQPFAGPQAVAVLFDKPSTRTRSSFSIGVAELGGYPLVIDKSGSQLAAASRSPTLRECSPAWPTASSGERSVRTASKRWRNTPPARSSTR